MTKPDGLTPKRALQFGALSILGALVSVGFFSAFVARENATNTPLPAAAPANLSGSAVAPPLALPHTVLQDTTGELFTLHPGEKPLLLLYFGNSLCLDACSKTLSTLAQARDRLTPAERDRLQIVVVSTDPEHDTPAVLRDWLSNFDPTFIGLTGYRVIIEELMTALRLPVPPLDGKSDSATPGNVLAFEPDGVAHRSYPAGTSVAAYSHDISALLATLP